MKETQPEQTDRLAFLRARLRQKPPDDVRSRRLGHERQEAEGKRQKAESRKTVGSKQNAEGRKRRLLPLPYAFCLLRFAFCLLPSALSKSFPEPDLKTKVVVAVAQIPLRTLFVLRDE